MKRLLEVVAVLASLGLGLARAPQRVAIRRSPAEDAAIPTRADIAERGTWKRRLVTIAAFLMILGIGGVLVTLSGIMPIKASSGHWGITAWFLNFAMARSVSTHSLGIKAPELDQPHLVLRGARHYDTGCRPCHGSPDLLHPRVAQAMTPHPPYLSSVMAQWRPEELFYIVKHGVKFTGMPAWPAQDRDDEVWAVVAFLLELPRLDSEGYRDLAQGDGGSIDDDAAIDDLTAGGQLPQLVTESCARCHGVNGLGKGMAAFPRLAGQSPAYLEATLGAFAAGDRHSGIMEPIAAGLSPEETAALGRYYSGLEPSLPISAHADEELSAAIERGARIAHYGIPEQRVPACIDCHGPSDGSRNPYYPTLSGQYAEYLVLQLELFKDRHRGGTDYAHLMHEVASGLQKEQMADVAAYYASLSP